VGTEEGRDVKAPSWSIFFMAKRRIAHEEDNGARVLRTIAYGWSKVTHFRRSLAAYLLHRTPTSRFLMVELWLGVL
jgi:hypothetical protein